MRFRSLLAIAFLLIIKTGSAQFNYAVSNIPDTLKKNVAVVYRLDEAFLNVLSQSEYTYQVHQIITLLSPEAEGYLQHQIGIDKFNSLQNIQVSLYNADGILQKTYSKKEFETFAAYDGISLVTDDKVMALKTPSQSYPCTIDVRYEIKNTGYIELPDWNINPSASTEIFRYTVMVSSDLDIRYKEKNINLKPIIKDSAGIKKYVWELQNCLPRKIEGDGYQRIRYVSSIQVAPNIFQYDGYAGSFKNWNRFGAWCYSLYNETTSLSKQRSNEIMNLVANHNEARERINILYSYLKSNMRYVSIQLGIGGFKPFSSAFVDEKKYGDCKALTNYMRTMLGIAGIKSYPALINAGYDNPPLDPDFPSSPFNHVILCVPIENDTVWLECTSNTAEIGYLGTFTENKIALLLTEQGGKLIKTPFSNYLANQLKTINRITINDDGSAQVQQEILSSGSYADFFRQIIKSSPETQAEYLRVHFSYKTSDRLNLVNTSDTGKMYKANMILNYPKFFDFRSGNKLFIQPRFFKLANHDLKQDERSIEYVFEEPYLKTDITLISIPARFKWESLLENKTIDAGDFYYSREVIKLSEETLQIKTQLILKKNIIPAVQYKTAFSFFNEVKKEENKKLVLLTP